MLIFAMGARGEDTAAAERLAAQRAIDVLAASSNHWFEKQACVSCHHQALPLLVFGEAKKHGLRIPDETVSRVANKTFAIYRSAKMLDRSVQGSEVATGEAVTVLERGGFAGDAVRRGIEYLLRSQHENGTWEVATRIPPPAPLNPPYFDSRFGYGHNQMISCAGTAWAAWALLLALPAAGEASPAAWVTQEAEAPAPEWIRTVLFGSAGDVERLIEAGWDVNSRTGAGTTALMMAAAEPAKARLLLNRGAAVDARAQSGYSALMVAANYGNSTEAVRLLLDRGATVGAGTPAPQYRASPLLLAISTAELPKVKLLMDGDHDLRQSMMVAGFAKTTALQFALFNADIPMVELLASHGADVNEADDQGVSPVAMAAICGSAELVRTLLRLGAKPNARDSLGMTPLLWAAFIDYGDDSVVRALLDGGADARAQSKEGRTALGIAQKLHRDTVVRILADRAGK